MENQELTKQRNPAEYLKIFFRRKWLFLSPVFIGFVLGIISAFLLPPRFESSTIILVEEEKVINPLIGNLAVSTSMVQRVATIKEQILGWDSLVDLIKKLDLARNVNTQLEFENLIATLRRNIIVQVRANNLVKISYFGETPEKTQVVAKTLTDVFIERNKRSQTKETDVAIEFIKNQLQVYKRKIKESEVANLEEQLKTLLVDSTEQHPLVKELRQKIDVAKKELDSGEYKVTGNEQPIANPAYTALKQEIEKITNKESAASPGTATAYAAENTEAQDPNSAIYKVLLMDKVDSVLARDIRVNENIYNMLLQKLETAKITQSLEISKEGTRYTIIDPPRLPLKPTKPNKLLVIFLGIFFGSTCGTGLVFGKEFMDHSFLDIDDAKQNLELPVLGAISRLTTQEEIDKEKYRKKKAIIISSVLSAVLILVAMLVAFFKS